jgi:hypothetical protein
MLGAVTLVILALAGQGAFVRELQIGLRPLQRLDRRLLIDTENDRLVRPVDTETDHVNRFRRELSSLLSHQVSLPKIRSVWIRSLSQNHRIIRADVCDPARAVALRCRHFQVATQAGSREPVSSSSA